MQLSIDLGDKHDEDNDDKLLDDDEEHHHQQEPGYLLQVSNENPPTLRWPRYR